MEKPFERLRQARIEAGFKSASAAARKFGWGDATYRHHENGTRAYGIDQAQMYGEAFGVSPIWLLDIGPSARESWRVPVGKFFTEVVYPELTYREGLEELLELAGRSFGMSFVIELDVGVRSMEVKRKESGDIVFHIVSPETLSIPEEKFKNGFLFFMRAPVLSSKPAVHAGDLVLVDGEYGEVNARPELLVVRNAEVEDIVIGWVTQREDGQGVILSDGSGRPALTVSAEDGGIIGKVLWVGHRL
ncbi:helix-turn-helix domain-containing protein [Flavisphingomonas formosensis]|uniref:helix-turn-helix domain-containing protein n=1 Tax=Flavisphingomonas formosensis TaxID=861534 RepID=UPI0012F9EB37|nr:helix-turn-helix transcriptional regulator [Sphingomonas formosensis]